jgi:hypothetical protein
MVLNMSELNLSGADLANMGGEKVDYNFDKANQITEKVIEMMNFMLEEEIQKLSSENTKKYEEMMTKKFYQFYDRYPTLFFKIIKGEDITPLFKMIEMIKAVEEGKRTTQDVEIDMGKKLFNKFVAPSMKDMKK